MEFNFELKLKDDKYRLVVVSITDPDGKVILPNLEFNLDFKKEEQAQDYARRWAEEYKQKLTGSAKTFTVTI